MVDFPQPDYPTTALLLISNVAFKLDKIILYFYFGQEKVTFSNFTTPLILLGIIGSVEFFISGYLSIIGNILAPACVPKVILLREGPI